MQDRTRILLPPIHRAFHLALLHNSFALAHQPLVLALDLETPDVSPDSITTFGAVQSGIMSSFCQRFRGSAERAASAWVNELQEESLDDEGILLEMVDPELSVMRFGGLARSIILKHGEQYALREAQSQDQPSCPSSAA
jgi:hypothetical protein